MDLKAYRKFKHLLTFVDSEFDRRSQERRMGLGDTYKTYVTHKLGMVRIDGMRCIIVFVIRTLFGKPLLQRPLTIV